MLFTVITAVVETLAGPLLVLVWMARTVLLAGGVLFLLAAIFAHKGLGIALLYFAQAVSMTLLLRFLRRLQIRALDR
jgi:hypothetical protein